MVHFFVHLGSAGKMFIDITGLGAITADTKLLQITLFLQCSQRYLRDKLWVQLAKSTSVTYSCDNVLCLRFSHMSILLSNALHNP